MSRADPEAGPARLLLEKLRLVLVLMGRDFGRLHGLVRLVVFMLLFLIVFSIVIGFASDVFVQVGVPSWTGDILEGDGPGGVEALSLDLSADVHIGVAPLTVTVEPRVEHAEGTVKYRWYVDQQGEGGEPASRSSGPLTWTFEEPTMHSIALRVEDDRGEIDPERLWFSVLDPMDGSVQVIVVANETEGESPMEVAFEAHPHGGLAPYTFAWSFGDGTTSDQRAPTHTFEARGEEEFRVTVVVTDRTGNMTPEQEVNIQLREDEGGSLGFTLLDFAYGFCVLVCVVMAPVAFTAAYRQELVKGTVRTLVCYPVGPLDITLAKLFFTFIMCLPFVVLAFLIPVQGLEKPGGDTLLIFVVTFLLTVVTMAIGAMAALAATRLTGRMWVRPHTLAFLAVFLAYLSTTRMMELMGTFFSRFTSIDSDFFVDTFGPLIAASPYHIGGEALNASLGGTGDPNLLVLVLPFLLLAVLGYLASRAYPSVFEKE